MRNQIPNDLLTMDPASVEYRETLALLLNRLDPTKPKGTKLCDAFMRQWQTPAFEAVLFRKNKEGAVEIYLRRRALDDTAYPGEWHAPGSLYRSGERDQDVANRLRGEFGCAITFGTSVGRIITSEVRGTIQSLIFLVQAAGKVRIDERHQWFPVDQLPKVTVDLHELEVIPLAVAAYRSLNSL